ncbi:hypothetical protein [Nonomuraea dietziae]|uniref:hypothetical protein n=1 Tax=Nonomuraea dietziae TaxID=65515 RepID=UPI0031D53B9C
MPVAIAGYAGLGLAGSCRARSASSCSRPARLPKNPTTEMDLELWTWPRDSPTTTRRPPFQVRAGERARRRLRAGEVRALRAVAGLPV